MAIARAADSQGISVSQYVREAALIRAVLDELDTAEEALHTAHDLLAIAREVRRLAEVDPPGPPRANAGRGRSASAASSQTASETRDAGADASPGQRRSPVTAVPAVGAVAPRNR